MNESQFLKNESLLCICEFKQLQQKSLFLYFIKGKNVRAFTDSRITYHAKLIIIILPFYAISMLVNYTFCVC